MPHATLTLSAAVVSWQGRWYGESAPTLLMLCPVGSTFADAADLIDATFGLEPGEDASFRLPQDQRIASPQTHPYLHGDQVLGLDGTRDGDVLDGLNTPVAELLRQGGQGWYLPARCGSATVLCQADAWTPDGRDVAPLPVLLQQPSKVPAQRIRR